MHHRQHQQHKHHHLQAAGQLIKPFFHLFVDFLLLQAGEKIAAEPGKLRLTAVFQPGGFDGQNALQRLHKKVVEGRTFQLQLLGVPAIAKHRPDADKPHDGDAHRRNRRQHGGNPEHDGKRDGADHPVGAQAVVQFDFLQQPYLPGGEAAVNLPRRALFKKTQRVAEQAGKPDAAVDQHKAFDKPLADDPHAQRHEGRDNKRHDKPAVGEVAVLRAGEGLVDRVAHHGGHQEQGE